MARSAVVLALVLGAAASLPGSAAGSGPSDFSLGFVADSLFPVYGSALAVPSSWYTRMERIGSSWTRVDAYWYAIAPTRPPAGEATNPGYSGYDWTYLDQAVRAASAAHQRILITVAYAPAWALGAGAQHAPAAHVWRPDPVAYGQFARAVASRFSGHFADPANPALPLPRVDYFQAWNEPNLADQLAPQWTQRGKRAVPASPAIYRALLNAAYAGIKAVQPRARVVTAGLAPYGDPPGGQRMAPVQFLSELLCLSGPALVRERCPAPAHFDALAHHPYSLTPTLPARSRLDVSVPDLWKLWRVLHAAQNSGRALPRGHKDLWVTEIAWDSNPPDPATPISTARQARYLSLVSYELWRQGVSHLFWTEVRDPGEQVGNLTGSGLFFPSSRAKPATLAFHFPFVALSGPGHRLTIWGRAPDHGSVVVQRRLGHRWVAWLRTRTTGGGVFFLAPRASGVGALRAVSRGVASLPF